MKYLYKDFLRDKKVYSLNEAFYKRLLKTITGDQPASFFQKTYANGSKLYDDHIFSTKYGDRILQIIQHEPLENQPFLKVHVQKWDNQYDLLVLSLELSDAIKMPLQNIIRAWLLEGATPEKLQTLLPEQRTKSYQEKSMPITVVNEDMPKKA